MEDQTRRLTESTRDLKPEELSWQPSPGMNTIGMLLAHIAIVELFWVHVGPAALTEPEFDSVGVLGIGADDDGLPLPESGAPPAVLAGRDLAFFDDVLARARAHTRRHTLGLRDQDLGRMGSLTRPDGTSSSFTVRWVLYHILEHQAGHYGQILLLRHLYRDAFQRT
jgi:uncharacterized damage-inducible protein DinB